MSNDLDPRLNAYRPDLADARLKDKVPATTYAEGNIATISSRVAAIRQAPKSHAALDTEALFGQKFLVLEKEEGWAWGQLQQDNYVGYIQSNALDSVPNWPTHRVTAQATFLFPKRDIKAPPVLRLPLLSELEIGDEDDEFLQTKNNGFIYKPHTDRIDSFKERDFVSVAERFIETPYLWGGRTCNGIDCSGLVQIAREACGFKTPRDSDMQRDAIGTHLHIEQALSNLQRGDLIFWNGHVGIMTDPQTLLHANAHHLKTVKEPLDTVTARAKKQGSEIIAIRRPEAKPISGT